MPIAAHHPSFHDRNRVHGLFFRVEAPVPVIVFLFVSLLALLATMAAFGQNPSPRTSQPAVLETLVYSNQCPLTLSAQQGSSGQLRSAQDIPSRAGQQSVSQQIRLTLTNPRLIGITAARIKVHGYTPTARVLPSAPPSPDAARSLDLVLTVAPGQNATTDLRLESFSAVTSIELESVSYSDGTRWQAGAEARCQIAPDPILLITSR